jgi:hypothetical protein
MFLLILLEDAKKEWLDASVYYELQKKGLGEKFSSALQEYLKLIQESPKHYQKTKKEYREILVSPFPFVIVFRIDKPENAIVVVSIFHTKRKPKLKYNRE